MTARFNLGFLLCVSIACSSDDGSGAGSSSSDGSSGASASATDPDSTVTATVTDPDTTVTATASDTQADSSTTDPTATTTTDPTQGDSSTDTAGTSTDATGGSSTGTTDASSSSSDASAGSSDTGVMPAAGYGDCVNNPEARVCIEGEICALDPDGQLGFCTLQGCTDETDCPSVSSGNPTVTCIDANQDMVQDCMLGCSMGETCPDGMICVFDAFCVWQA
jgi:hypothetical protein